MCGIFCSVHSPELAARTHALEHCCEYLKRRGPDHFSTFTLNTCNKWILNFAASVLWTQGKCLCQQPCQLSRNILCWNGDVFAGPLDRVPTSGEPSDTEIISKLLLEFSISGKPLTSAMHQIHGPYSLIYFNQEDDSLWFGRDPAGRHSLLWGFEDCLSLTISSVAPACLTQMKEVPTFGLFQLHLQRSENSKEFCVTLHPWCRVDENELKTYFSNLPISLKLASPVADDYIFSPQSAIMPLISPSELLLNSVSSISQHSSLSEIMESLMKIETYSASATKLVSLLEAAVSVRVSKMKNLCQLCSASSLRLSKPIKCVHSKVAVLFSGGLDSAILALLASRFISQNEPIDLLNVAFEKSQRKKILSNSHQKDEISRLSERESRNDLFDVPDRITGLQTLKELQVLCPKRTWNFVEINVYHSELQESRSKYISHVIHPLKTVLDDSLGCALWFATQGRGTVYSTKDPYTSTAKIVLIGMGADEQFGGYMRHRKAFQSGGWRALQKALEEDIQRIPSRNLGRDDRVISDHGRQPRLPYLDECVMKFVKLLSPWEKCWPNHQLPQGIGDKLLLRLVAWHIGLRNAALLPKRALQFGSRIANSKDNAADLSSYL